MTAPLGWIGILRLGLVQSCLGAVVMLTTSVLNRIMVVEFKLAAAIPAGLVAWHYAVQFSRPKWGHGSDLGHRRTPWIVGGMAMLALGGLVATDAALIMASRPIGGLMLALVGYTMIGLGVGACGTSLLALLASHVAPARRPAAAASTWVMMVAGIVIAAATLGKLLRPFSAERLALVASGVALVAFVVTVLATLGIEKNLERPAGPKPKLRFAEAVSAIWGDPAARHFTIFVFVSMLAYSMQDMILEPMAGIVFGFDPGQSTSLSGAQHGGVLVGMMLVGLLGGFTRASGLAMRRWIVGGCLGSAMALGMLCAGIVQGAGWPLTATVFALGFANGVFAVAAIAAMMDLAGADGGGSEGIRMGLWGASQAIAFGTGGFLGAVALDLARAFLPTGQAFVSVFSIEATLFVIAAVIALGIGRVGHGASIGREALA